MEFKLLVVDDERSITELLSQFFLEHGYQVVLAGSGDEAVSIIEREPVDLVILDLRMPGLPGEEVLRHIKTKVPKTKVVVVTGYPEREPGVRAIGCDGFFTKPLVIGDLIRRVDALLSQKDDDELRETMLGVRAKEALPGRPMAQLLFLEPIPALSEVLMRFFGVESQSGGIYKVHIAENLDQALAALQAVHPDILLLDLMALEQPGQIAKALLACNVQPKEYIFYLRSRRPAEEEEFLASVTTKRWEGNPFEKEGLMKLADLVGKTALEHSLVKR